MLVYVYILELKEKEIIENAILNYDLESVKKFIDNDNKIIKQIEEIKKINEFFFYIFMLFIIVTVI